ncbi:Susd and RagB outer membrane lipoprotein [compost metagenome]
MFLSFAAIVSCDEELNINENPNTPQQINVGLALTSAETSLATVVGGELTNLGGFMVQYQTQAPSASQYENFDSYNMNAPYSNRFWTELYAGCLSDLEYVITESTSKKDTGSVLIATCLKSYTFQILTDLFGPIPYTEALQGLENITPAPTPQEEIYPDLIAKINKALADYNANPTDSEAGSQDVIYGGDMDSWVQFANTLKLRIYLRMAYTSQANPAAVNALLAQNNFITKDAAYANFSNTLNKTNPFYGIQLSSLGNGFNGVNNIASDTFLNFLIDNGDQRKELIYRPKQTSQATPAITYVSIVQGSGNDFNDTAVSYSKPNLNPLSPVAFMTVAESNFLQAEAKIRYAGGAGAKENYDAGVIASFRTNAQNFPSDDDLDGIFEATDSDLKWEFMPYTPDEAEAFAVAHLAPGGNYEYVAGGSVEQTVRQVIIQKWAALAFVNNIEAYFESTRSKFPEVVLEDTEDYSIGNRIPSRISVLSGTTVPSILFYPEQEVNRNPNITQRTSLIEKVWWDQK